VNLGKPTADLRVRRGKAGNRGNSRFTFIKRMFIDFEQSRSRYIIYAYKILVSIGLDIACQNRCASAHAVTADFPTYNCLGVHGLLERTEAIGAGVAACGASPMRQNRRGFSGQSYEPGSTDDKLLPCSCHSLRRFFLITRLRCGMVLNDPVMTRWTAFGAFAGSLWWNHKSMMERKDLRDSLGRSVQAGFAPQ